MTNDRRFRTRISNCNRQFMRRPVSVGESKCIPHLIFETILSTFAASAGWENATEDQCRIVPIHAQSNRLRML